MAKLTYETTHQKTVTKTHTVEVFDHWAMYSTAGNRRLKTLAQKFLNVAETKPDFMTFSKSAFDFLKGYRKMETCKSYGEAGDTAVRETVWAFLEQVCSAVNRDADELWDAKEGYPKL